MKKKQSLRVNYSKILRVKNAKFSGYYFYLKANIYRETLKFALVCLKKGNENDKNAKQKATKNAQKVSIHLK